MNNYLFDEKRDRTIKEYSQDLKHIFSTIPIYEVVELSLDYLDHNVASQIPGLSPATTRRRLSSLGSFLNALHSCGFIPYNIIEQFERPELVDRLPGYLSSD